MSVASSLPGRRVAMLVSFDIDGTLETGLPPGPVLLEHVVEVKRRGCLIGSASDRTVADQQRMWRESGIEVDFVGHKHDLITITASFACARYLHIGDTDVDEHYSKLAGFEFWHVEMLPDPGSLDWIY